MLNVPPCFSIHRVCNGCSGHSKFFRYLVKPESIEVIFSHIFYDFPREFCSAPFFSKWKSILSPRILSVVKRCAYKNVIWIYTIRIVTFMAGQKPIWNWSIFRFPCESVGKHAAITIPKCSIPPWLRCSGPSPTAFRFGNLFPKSFFGRSFGYFFVPCATRVRTINPNFVSLENYSTFGTLELDHMKTSLSMVRECQPDRWRSHFFNLSKSLGIGKVFNGSM